MKTFARAKIQVIVDLLTNLSAGWFAMVLIAPGILSFKLNQEAVSWTLQNLLGGLFSLSLALKLAEGGKLK